jgi:hypothetical protein
MELREIAQLVEQALANRVLELLDGVAVTFRGDPFIILCHPDRVQ